MAKLISDGAAATTSAHFSVAIDGNKVVVGPTERDGGSDSGGRRPWTISTSARRHLRQTSMLVAPACQDGTADAGRRRFGISVAIDGDTVVVGAYGDDTIMARRSTSFA